MHLTPRKFLVRNKPYIKHIAASEASENSRVMLGYGEKCSEAKRMVRFTKSEAKNKRVKSMLYFTPCSTKPDFRNVLLSIDR